MFNIQYSMFNTQMKKTSKGKTDVFGNQLSCHFERKERALPKAKH